MSKRTAVGESEHERRFDDLFNSHYVAVHRYCYRRLGPADAEDAAAEVFAVAWRRLSDLPDDGSSLAWLLGVAYRVIGNQYRSRRRQTNLKKRLIGRAATQPTDGGTDYERGSDREILLQALSALGPGDVEILRLSAWDGLSRSQIAVVLGLKENAVDQRLHRARRRLRTRLAQMGEETPHLNSKEASA